MESLPLGLKHAGKLLLCDFWSILQRDLTFNLPLNFPGQFTGPIEGLGRPTVSYQWMTALHFKTIVNKYIVFITKCQSYGRKIPHTFHLHRKTLWSAINRFLYSIGLVYFMICCMYHHDHILYHPFLTLFTLVFIDRLKYILKPQTKSAHNKQRTRPSIS